MAGVDNRVFEEETIVAIIFQDGFETGIVPPWTGSGGTPTRVGAPVHQGGWACQFNAANENCYKTFGAAYTVIFARAYLYFNSLPAAGEIAYIFSFMKDGAVRMRTGVYRTAGGTLQVVMTDIQWLVANFAFVTGRWYCWEIKWDSVADDYTVWIDDVQVLNSGVLSALDVNQINMGFIGGWTNPDFVGDCVDVQDARVGCKLPPALVPLKWIPHAGL